MCIIGNNNALSLVLDSCLSQKKIISSNGVLHEFFLFENLVLLPE